MPKIIHYRDKCIGCNICFEMQPEYWRLSRKDGKATLVNGILKNQTHVLEITESEVVLCEETASHCPVKVIKVL
ncbi:MAG: ferredoxin [Saprospiraceae bacterium]|nr:ferredoxin [Candidatus Vicinibacter proximus]MBL7821792.1 ferredoxin [Saprospiraceae bacterium]MCC6844202.1 ferredoxin [Saprospiraceae bacterium]HRG34153.1 ferredoxin [Saprospiraceae bacterium]